MRIHDFIFSDKFTYRIQRHLLFWIVRFFLLFLGYYGVVFLSSLASGDARYPDDLLLFSQTGLFRVAIDIAYCYAVVYWLLPRYLLKKRWLVSALLLFAMTIASFVANSASNIYLYDLMNQPREIFYNNLWIQSIHFIFSGSPVVCGAFLVIRMLKIWYIKEEEKVAITRANANAELQLLKAQIHPHFLFNTLNNIYSFTLAGRPQAADLANRLSGMMDYMSTEGEKELVPVEKEIQLIQDYMSLEKVRYDNRLDMQLEIKGDYQNKMIAPLLMIPFAENCFKHGASAMRGKIWVRLSMTIQDNRFYFDLSNSKPMLPPAQPTKKGIGLMNVQKRLKLIYPGKHILRTESTGTVYSVHLEVELQQQPALPTGDKPMHQPQSMSYA